MLRGAKKAILRTPHILLGTKSPETDTVLLEWSQDFVTAEEALAQVERETVKYVDNWREICKAQEAFGAGFTELYEPVYCEEERERERRGSISIGRRGSVSTNTGGTGGGTGYRPVQETPASALTAVAQYREFIGGRNAGGHGGLLEAIDPYLTYLEGPFLEKLGEAKKCVKSVQKLLTKREHKKIDYDRHTNSFEKIRQQQEKNHKGHDPNLVLGGPGGHGDEKKEALTEKEQLTLTRQQLELDVATEVFQEIDEKVKTIVPYMLTYMSEFLNSATASLYLTQLKIYEAFERILVKYAQEQGLAGSLSIAPSMPGLSTEYPILHEEGTKTATPGSPGSPLAMTEKPKPLVMGVKGEPDDYVQVMDGWEERFRMIQPRCEQAITTIREGETVKTKIGLSRESRKEEARAAASTAKASASTATLSTPTTTTQKLQDVTMKTMNRGLDLTADLAHKAIPKIPKRYIKNIEFSSPEHGFFRTEADLLQLAAVNGPIPMLPAYEDVAGSGSGSNGNNGVIGGNPNEKTVSPSGSTAGLSGFSFFKRSPAAAAAGQQNLLHLPQSSSGSGHGKSQSWSFGSHSRNPSVNQVSGSNSSSNSSPYTHQRRKSGIYGRSPVTSVFNNSLSESDTQQHLKTRVRASMSTAARAMNETPDTMESISNRIRSMSIDKPPSYGPLSVTPSSKPQPLTNPCSSSTNSTAISDSATFTNPSRILAPPNQTATALFTFAGQEPGDVAFQAGDTITVLDHGDETDQDWWFGKTLDGRVGLFPKSFVKVDVKE